MSFPLVLFVRAEEHPHLYTKSVPLLLLSDSGAHSCFSPGLFESNDLK